MSTEPRRIRKVIRHLTAEDLEEVHRRADGLKRASLGPMSPTLRRPYTQKVPGYVTLPQLAAERGIQPQLARIWIKNAGIKKPGYRWQWKEGSRELARVRKALGLGS